MWDVLFTLVGKALITLAGPVAISSFKNSRATRRQLDVLEEAITNSTLVAHTYSMTLDARLAATGVTTNETGKLRKFLESPEGTALVRQVAIECILNPDTPRKVLVSLVPEARALLRMYTGQNTHYVLASAPIIVSTLREVVIQVYRAIETRDNAIARTISHQAMKQRRSSNLVGDSNPELDIARSSRSLRKESASEMEQRIREYAALLADHVSTLSVPVVQRDIRVPLNKIYIHRTIASTGAERIHGKGLLDILAKDNQIVLLGNPGEGKSTMISASLLELALLTQKGDLTAVPIRIQLRHFAKQVDASPTSASIVKFITESTRTELSSDVSLNTWQHLLRLGLCVVFFDGLDEILSISTRQAVVARIESFVARFRLNCFLVTSRHADYPAAPLAGTFTLTQLLPFTDGLVEDFASRLFSLIDMPEGRRDAKVFMSDTILLSDIRSNALMLGVLCNLYSTGRRMPRNRLELYARCADMLFSDWDARKGIFVNVDDEINTELAVRELALEVFKSGEEEFREPWLRSFLKVFYLKLPGANLVSARRFAESAMGLWRGRKWIIAYAGTDSGDDCYRFTHRTFLEFFAAEQLVYECRNGSELCSNLGPYIVERSSAAFCLLAAETFCAGNRHAGSDLLEALLQYASRLGSEGDRRAAYYVLDFGLQTLPFVSQARAQLRLAVSAAITQLIASLLPWTAIRDHHRRHGSLDHPDSDRTRSGAASGSTAGKAHDRSREHEFGVVDLFAAYRHFADLKLEDVDAHLATVRDEIANLLLTDRLAALRFCVSLYFATWSPAWNWPEGRTAFREIGLALLKDRRGIGGVFGAAQPEPDYWSLVGGLALGVEFDAKWVSELDVYDFLDPVSNLDIPADLSVSLAHLVCGMILDWEWRGIWGETGPSSSAVLLEGAVSAIRANRTGGGSRVAAQTGAEASGVRRETLTDAEACVVVGFLGAFDPSGRGFSAEVLSRSIESNLVSTLKSIMRFRAEPGKPKTTAGSIKSGEDSRRGFQRLAALIRAHEDRKALFRLWKFDPAWESFDTKQGPRRDTPPRPAARSAISRPILAGIELDGRPGDPELLRPTDI